MSLPPEEGPRGAPNTQSAIRAHASRPVGDSVTVLGAPSLEPQAVVSRLVSAQGPNRTKPPPSVPPEPEAAGYVGAAHRPDKPPTSRFGRLARLTALAPKALPMAAEAVKRAMGVKRTEDEQVVARAKLLKSAKSTAEAMLKTLGEMKGLPLKLGQMASYIDGLAPPGYEEKFQRVLKQLQAKAPPLSREAATLVVTEDLGAPPDDIFAKWELDPFAAASIGQVHRATTRGGERVAVKVQYPGIDKAIENDLKSLSMLEAMIAPVGRRYHSKEGLEEVKSVFLAELDYTREAEMADTFRRIHEGDDEVVIPHVHHSLTTRRVLTCALVGGEDYSTFCERASQADRNAAGETIFRFMFRALFKHGLLYADPHPGNYRFLGRGKVAFLDFGCHKRLPDHLVEGMKRYTVAAQDQNWDEFYRACVEVLGYDPNDPDGWKLYTEYTKYVIEPLTVNAPYKYTHAKARENVAFLVRNGKKIVFRPDEKLPNLPKPIHVPQDMTFVSRLQWGLASVLAGLEAEANWRKIAAPWLHAPHEPVP
jgi:predicted unusual protein kinase regulating ubiquinone biosynthesis (AarF/ABC1/UbiB family)